MSKEEQLNLWINEVESRWSEEAIPEYRVDPNRIKHLAIICDGNRRAASERGLEPYFGHRVGMEVIKGSARAFRNWGVGICTYWVWSTDNWSRDTRQTEYVMGLAEENLGNPDFLQGLIRNQTKFLQIGRKERLPRTLQQTLRSLEQATTRFRRHRINLALDYGGRNEVGRAKDRLIDRGGALKSRRIEDFLDTAGQPQVDLVLRTGVGEGEMAHTSGFMPLQTIESAWKFLETPLPDLTPQELLASVQECERYNKRLGK